jgi:Family of unknown function (DUF5519)
VTDHVLWDAFVAAVLPLGPVHERVSRYGDKPALVVDNREIAHLEAPGVIDLRITQAGWSRVRDQFGADPAVRKERTRRDWLELVLESAAELDRLAPLLAVAVISNVSSRPLS